MRPLRAALGAVSTSRFLAIASKRSEKRAKAAAEKLGAGEKRIVADVPEHIHRQVRVRCLERGVLVRDYVLELLAKDGIR